MSHLSRVWKRRSLSAVMLSMMTSNIFFLFIYEHNYMIQFCLVVTFLSELLLCTKSKNGLNAECPFFFKSVMLANLSKTYSISYSCRNTMQLPSQHLHLKQLSIICYRQIKLLACLSLDSSCLEQDWLTVSTEQTIGRKQFWMQCIISWIYCHTQWMCVAF